MIKKQVVIVTMVMKFFSFVRFLFIRRVVALVALSIDPGLDRLFKAQAKTTFEKTKIPNGRADIMIQM